MERFWRSRRGCGGIGEAVEVLEGVVEHSGGFGEVWRFWGGLEVMQRQVWEPGLCLGVHRMIHQHIQAVSPHLLLPGQFPPCLAQEQRFPCRDEPDRGLLGSVLC